MKELQERWRALQANVRTLDAIGDETARELWNFLRECVAASENIGEADRALLQGITSQVAATLAEEPHTAVSPDSLPAGSPRPYDLLRIQSGIIEALLKQSGNSQQQNQTERQEEGTKVRLTPVQPPNRTGKFTQFSQKIPQVLRTPLKMWGVVGVGVGCYWIWKQYGDQILPALIAYKWPALSGALYTIYLVRQVRKSRDRSVTSPEDARCIVGTSALGYVPMIENEEARILSGSRSGGIVLESYRVLRSNVRFATVDRPLRSLAVTSTVRNEGKSVTAYNLAVVMALEGLKVILVDTNLQHPTLHTKAKVAQTPGLTDVLIGKSTLADAIQETGIPGLRVLTAGPLPPDPAALLASQAMAQVHQALKEQSDVVVFDSPPCLTSVDAQIIAAETDGVLYVVSFGSEEKDQPKERELRQAVEMLHQSRTHILGVTFNKIQMARSHTCCYYYGGYSYDGSYQTTPPEDGRPRRRRSTAEFEEHPSRNSAPSREPSTADQTPEEKATAPPESSDLSETQNLSNIQQEGNPAGQIDTTAE